MSARVTIGGILRLRAKAYRDQFERCFELYEGFEWWGCNPTYTVEIVRGATISLLESQGSFLRALDDEFPKGWYDYEEDRCAVIGRVKKENLTGVRMFDNPLLDVGPKIATADAARCLVDKSLALAMCQLVEELYAAGDWRYYNPIPLSQMDNPPDPLPHIRRLIAENVEKLKNTGRANVPNATWVKQKEEADLVSVLDSNTPGAVIKYIRDTYADRRGKEIAILMLSLKEVRYLTGANRSSFYRAFLQEFNRGDSVKTFGAGVDKYLNEAGKDSNPEQLTALLTKSDIAPMVEVLYALRDS